MKTSLMHEIFIDGASRGNPGPAGVGVVIIDSKESLIREFSRYIGQTTNNVAEYSALIYALLEADQIGCKSVSVKTDSELLARQISGQYKVKDARLSLMHDMAHYLLPRFDHFEIAHIPRELNAHADRLAGMAAKSGVFAKHEKTSKC